MGLGGRVRGVTGSCEMLRRCELHPAALYDVAVVFLSPKCIRHHLQTTFDLPQGNGFFCVCVNVIISLIGDICGSCYYYQTVTATKRQGTVTTDPGIICDV